MKGGPQPAAGQTSPSGVDPFAGHVPFKRPFDFVFSALLLVLLAIPMLVTAVVAGVLATRRP